MVVVSDSGCSWISFAMQVLIAALHDLPDLHLERRRARCSSRGTSRLLLSGSKEYSEYTPFCTHQVRHTARSSLNEHKVQSPALTPCFVRPLHSPGLSPSPQVRALTPEVEPLHHLGRALHRLG